MDFRLATSVPKSLTEMWERFREFVQQVQPVILLNVPIGTDETAVAHGLGEAPGHVEWDPPHCLAIVKQTRRADRNRVYLKASNACVLDIKVTRGFPRALLNSVKNGGYKLPDYDPNAFGDHRVATDATDEAAHGADYLLSKLSDSGNVKPTLDTSAGKRRVRHDVTLPTGFPGYYDNDPEPDGTANPGDSPLVSRGNHVHPRIDPSVEGATLYPAYIPDPILRAPCLYYAALGAGYGLNFSQWTQIGGISTWQANFLGTSVLQGFVAAGNVPLNVGNRFFVDCTATGTHQYDGVYEVVAPSDGVHYAIIRRVADANAPAGLCHGMVVQVLNDGTGSAVYRSLTTSDPIVVDSTSLTFTSSRTYTSGAMLRALTNAQILSSGATSTEYPADTTITSSTPVLASMLDTPTLPWTPGVGEIPAGRWKVTAARAKATGGDAGATTVLKACFGLVAAGWVDGDAFPTPFLTATSPPLTATETTVTFESDLSAPVTCTPDQRILWWWAPETTSATGVTVAFIWQDGMRTTRVTTTLQFATTTPPATRPGWGIATESGGYVTIPTGYTSAILNMAASDMLGIDATGIPDATEICLLIDSPTTSNHQGISESGTATGSFLPLVLEGRPTASNDIDMVNTTLCKFKLDVAFGVWVLSGHPITYGYDYTL